MWVTAAAVRAITGSDPNSPSPSESAPLETAPRLDLTPDEKTLSGMIHLSPSQARTTLELISSVTCRKPKKSATTANK